MTHQNNSTPLGQDILTEITPLSDCDFFYMVDRTKDAFNFPIHKHNEFEINYVENCAGARRVVGDNMETIGDRDLCLIGHGIEHGWEQADCTSNNIREITIQFPADIFGEEMLKRTQMASIKAMLDSSSKGIAFPESSIEKVSDIIKAMNDTESSFDKMIKLLELACTVHRSRFAHAQQFVVQHSGRIVRLPPAQEGPGLYHQEL